MIIANAVNKIYENVKSRTESSLIFGWSVKNPKTVSQIQSMDNEKLGVLILAHYYTRIIMVGFSHKKIKSFLDFIKSRTAEDPKFLKKIGAAYKLFKPDEEDIQRSMMTIENRARGEKFTPKFNLFFSEAQAKELQERKSELEIFTDQAEEIASGVGGVVLSPVTYIWSNYKWYIIGGAVGLVFLSSFAKGVGKGVVSR